MAEAAEAAWNGASMLCTQGLALTDRNSRTNHGLSYHRWEGLVSEGPSLFDRALGQSFLHSALDTSSFLPRLQKVPMPFKQFDMALRQVQQRRSSREAPTSSERQCSVKRPHGGETNEQSAI